MKILKGGYTGQNNGSFPFFSETGQKYYLLHLIRGRGKYLVNGISYEMKEGDSILIQPGTPYQYQALTTPFLDDWLFFEPDGKVSLPSVLTCDLPLRLKYFDRCASLIWQIVSESTVSDITPPRKNSVAEDNISALFFVLQNHLSQASYAPNEAGGTSPYLQKFRILRRQIQNEPGGEHNISRYAAKFCMSTSHFQHLYSQFFGISFQNDLIRMRISYAQKLLQTTSLSTEQVSEVCGYSNSTHFFRQFKKITGNSPAKCRMPKTEGLSGNS